MDTKHLVAAPDPDSSRPELILGATLYLMTHYARTGCPRLATCVARHLQCLALHPGVDQMVRDLCAGLHGAWAQPGIQRTPLAATRH